MPTYEYKCKKCSHHFEVRQKISEQPLTQCPACGGTIDKVFYPAGIIFKGSGFYITDSRAEKKKREEKKVTPQKKEDVRGQKAEEKGQKREDRKRKTEERGQKTD